MNPRSLCSGVVALAVVLGACVIPAAANAQPAATPSAHNGSSAATAAASCWDIKQQNPSSKDGVYWLQTPAMNAPQRFFCDQTMDGGGWVLIGRGREGWETWSQGKGDAAKLTTRTRTPADFDPVQLSNSAIDGLLNNTAPASLAEGLRVVRAYDTSGSRWQSVDIKPSIMPSWTWLFKSLTPAMYRIDGGSWRREGIIDDGLGSGTWTSINMMSSHLTGYKLGFGYGKGNSFHGSSPSSYIIRSGRVYMPYAEAYIRPRISSDSGFAMIADAGTQASTGLTAVSEFARRTAWGVAGNLNGSIKEGNIQVQAFEQVGDTMFVGGNFTGVQNGAYGAIQRTAGLAAFDASSGAWKSSLTFDFNDQVKDLLALPDGRLLVVGDFTRVRGERHAGTVVIDPRDGSIDPNWDLHVESGIASSPMSVTTAVLGGDFVYLGGRFTHLSGQGANRVYARSAGRVSLAGKPDRSWNPEVFGSVLAADVDVDSERYYAGGHFKRTKSGYANHAAILSTRTARLDQSFEFVPSSHRGQYQQAVDVVGNRFFFGGAQHSLFGYDSSSNRRISSSITMTNGGDMQAITHSDNGVLYASCHCSDYSYQDADNFDRIGENWTRANEIQWVGGWDSATGDRLEWTPYRLSSLRSTGAWALKIAADGALWAGGDFTRSFTSTHASQWNGGFAIYPARDTTPPIAPSGLKATAIDAAGVTLNWRGVEDAVAYEILRDDRPIATADTTTLRVPLGGANRFFVRAVDSAGNRSASTPVFTPGGIASDTQLLADSATWKFRWSAEAPDASWATPGYDDSQWDRGAAPIGYGDSQLGTVINASALSPRPVATYFRTTFTVDDPTAIGGVEISYTADDGAAVYVNGKEVQRTRLTEGAPLHHGFYANKAVTTAQARTQRASVVVASSLLTPGANTIAVETHVNYRSSPSMTMQATVTTIDAAALPGNAIPAAVDETPSDPGTVQPDDSGRPEPIEPPNPRAQNLVSSGDEWSYWAVKEVPSADWMTEFDLASWERGKTPIGWGSAELATPLSIPSADRAAAYYFSRDVEVMNLTESTVMTLSVRADDGAVVYVNGVEVGRQRMNEGPVTHSTYATAPISTQKASENPLLIEVPASVLREGSNRISVEEHLNYRSTPSMTFDATVSITR
ncbi:fibrinogen-like YCDxxxxGGGW domain-containing protein [Actinomyces mediterranea]|uniref:fibrinogen-like YCDxxxxGGGW domain-containing protein n=1 Tax=Actinomyces mediterranea TaxID=1871028 RepID=UPI00101AE49A|nr:fibrinogen-like YCDxxxxGGGW domain-containing protein [Actinomyces mediterranea]